MTGLLLFIWVLTCYGGCNALVFGSIFEGFRNALKVFGTGGYSLHKLFTCMMCLPTWFGMILSLALNLLGFPTPWTLFGVTLLPLVVILDGIFTSGCVWIIHTLQEFFETED